MTATRLSIGNFQISSNNLGISACATVATRGSADTAVPFNPGTVEIVPGPTNNSIDIQVRQLLFFGGALNSLAFHAASVC